MIKLRGAQIGVAYGRNGQGLPSPSQVVDIYKRNGIKRMRIYDPFPPTLEALGGSNIELTVGAPNDQLEYLNNRANVDAWVRDIRNLIRVVKSGTPKRPNRPIETYIFAMFDENQKPDIDVERHFGIFQPNGQSKYGPINFN